MVGETLQQAASILCGEISLHLAPKGGGSGGFRGGWLLVHGTKTKKRVAHVLKASSSF